MTFARTPGADDSRTPTPPALDPTSPLAVRPSPGHDRTVPARRAPVRTVAVVGAKGGVGRSVIAANLAVALGRTGHRVLLFDADLVLGDAARLLGALDAPGAGPPGRPAVRPGLLDVLHGRARLDDVVREGPSGTSVIPSSGGDPRLCALSLMDHASLVALFSDLDTTADTLVIDTPSGLSDEALCHAGAAREILVVTGPEPAAMEYAIAAMRTLHERYRTRRFRIVANGARDAAHGLDLYAELAQRVGVAVDARTGAAVGADWLLDYAGSVPTDPKLVEAVARGRPVAELFPRAPSALAFGKLAARVARWPRPATPAGHIEFFVERLVQAAGPPLTRATTA